ncbi:hypothetical protein K435DRAFT_64971 [Dendrothele bispora CBS 962.96]|uniref:Zn(2)-C6 fungal-type domain-containing protein n=1 Tax=Dendrothele bispora (strain CBS 962.96) TaxID=1314807 RepID=A0A4S8KR19_DENBC|nr:hypothetical protein K435DRAFT_64971 [Dendrothele bispora CBS 962.96]
MPRGSSCLNCRRRRIKCDAARPICNNCQRSPDKFGDCEYAAGGPSNVEALEEQISIMENRIRELENPTQPPGSMVLQDPYAKSSSVRTALARNAPSAGTLDSAELPTPLRQSLLSTFLQYATQLGFFLDPSSLNVSSPSSSVWHPAPALLQTVLLLGAQLSSSQTIDSNTKAHLLSQALKTTPYILSSNHPNKVLQAIQTHVLLSQYFFINGRFLEGKYHLTMSVSLVLSTGLHRIQSRELEHSHHIFSTGSGQLHDSSSSLNAMLPPMTSALSPSRYAEEEKEKISAFWTVVILNSCWSTVEGTTSSLAYWKPEFAVYTPWPGTISEPDVRSNSTIQRFLSNTSDDVRSVMALHAKASILFEQTFELSRSYNPTLSPEFAQTWFSRWNTLRSVVQRFQVPSIDSVLTDNHNTGEPAIVMSRQLLVIHTLICVVKIRIIRFTPVQSSTSSYGFAGNNNRDTVIQIALEAAMLIKKTNLQETTFVDPILAMLWTTIGRILSEEISSAPSTTDLRSGRSLEVSRRVNAMRSALDTIYQTMSMLASTLPLMGRQLQNIRGASGSSN